MVVVFFFLLFQDSGSYLEHRMAGVYTVTIQGLNTGTLDLTTNGWGHVVGLDGERRRVHSEQGMGAVAWKPGKDNQPLTWYRRRFDPPSGTDPVVIDLTPMGKGFLFVNGEGLGRYWVSYHHALGKPSQYLYHVPRSLLRPKGNTLMFFEEEGGKPDAIMILTVKRDNICTFMTEKNPAHVRWSWESKDSQPKAVAGAGAGAGGLKPTAVLSCPTKKTIQSVVFASYGNPLGICGNYTVGSCHAPRTKEVVEKACVGRKTCSLVVSSEVYGGDVHCPGTTGTLAVQAKCSKRPPRSAATAQ